MMRHQLVEITDSEGTTRLFFLNRHLMIEGRDYLVLQMVISEDKLAEEAIVMYAETDGTELKLEPVEDEALLSHIEKLLDNL